MTGDRYYRSRGVWLRQSLRPVAVMWGRLKADIEARLGQFDGTIRNLADLDIIKAGLNSGPPGLHPRILEHRCRFSGAVARFAPQRKTRIQKGGDAWATIR